MQGNYYRSVLISKAIEEINDADKMGAKAPEKLKLRRQPCSCEICGRKFVNIQALTSHRKFVHKPKPAPAAKLEKEAKQAKDVKKITNQSDSKTKTPNKKPMIKIIDKKDLSDAEKVSAARKILFKCPNCNTRAFASYFSAFRHIQKHHCVDVKGNPVAPNSPALIKPLRYETCLFCQKMLDFGQEHSCQDVTEHILEYYMCLGCQQTFDNIVLFKHHVKGLHGNGAEYFFFPSKEEFASWKADLENSVKIKYVTLTNSKQKSKQAYHCSHQPALKTDKTLLCPSSLSVSEFKNSYLVIYYKEHFGHTCPEMISTKYKRFLISPFFKNADGITPVDKDDSVYQQFKNIMNIISLTASKADISLINTLLGKALEMAVLLNTLVSDEQATVNKSMTDDQITDVLAEVKTYPGKRKAESVKKDAKKVKPTVENDENSKANNSLPVKESSKSVKKPVTETKPKKPETELKKTVSEPLPVTPLARPLMQSPSFNDSYKDFVDQNFATKLNDSSTPKKSTVKKKVVMKTKIGQFKMRPSLSPKGPTDVKEKSTLSPKPASPKPQSPKPSSPKREKTILKTIEYKIKPDVEYEVKEQENDCNILILKI